MHAPVSPSAALPPKVSQLGDARRGKFADNLTGFGRALRRAGIPVDASRMALAQQAALLVGVARADLGAALEAVLSLLPLDSYVEHSAHVMQVVGDAKAVPEAVAGFTAMIGARGKVGSIERFAFYQRAKQCFAIVQTGEGRLYGNIILTKGVIPAA